MTTKIRFLPPSPSMRMPVMQVRIMRVLMNDRGVPVPVRMGFAGRVVRAMRVPVMLVMHMAMLVIDRGVSVLVLVTL